MFDVIISTDGACSGNPGPGAWATILRCKNTKLELAGFNPHTTNNAMEYAAVVNALMKLRKPSNITLRCDSKIVCDAINTIESMHKLGWTKKTGAKYAHINYLQQIYDLLNGSQLGQNEKHSITAVHVKAHNGDEDNELCDRMARAEILKHVG